MPRAHKTPSATKATGTAQPAPAEPATAAPTGSDQDDEPAVSEPAVSGPAVSGPAVSGPAVSGPAVSEPAVLEAPESEAQLGDGAPSFPEAQREALLAERASYLRQAEELKAEADSLALEHEPGDVQFDEEGGEGGTSNVDRELDLLLSAQARGAIAEIDRALAKIDAGTYGICEHCGQPIAEARLEALPYAALCVACKSGGLSSRR
jgi:DnaK suppressor protein